MNSTHEDVAANIRAELARRRIRQHAVASALGLNQQQVSRRLNGVVEFSATELRNLAQLLEVPVGALLGEVSA